jgi:hypothetical protein
MHHHNKSIYEMTRVGIHLKQVANISCINAKSNKMIITPPPTLAKNINEKD